MPIDYYSYSEIEEDQNIQFTFFTKNNIVFSVYFEIDTYSSFISEFPILLNTGYSFGFRTQKYDPDQRVLKDDLIFPTIYKIIKDFIENCGKNTVLLYHCDVKDNKQSARNKLFNNWAESVKDTYLVKHTIEAEIQRVNIQKKVKYHLGFITCFDNPDLSKVIEEFEQFSYNITLPKE